jgi:hypothetical protein
MQLQRRYMLGAEYTRLHEIFQPRVLDSSRQHLDHLGGSVTSDNLNPAFSEETCIDPGSAPNL